METDNNLPNNSHDQNFYAAPDSAPVLEKKKKGIAPRSLAKGDDNDVN